MKLLKELNEHLSEGTLTDDVEYFLNKKYKVITSETGRILIEKKVGNKKVRFEIGVYQNQLSVHPKQKTEDDAIHGEAENIEMAIRNEFKGLTEAFSGTASKKKYEPEMPRKEFDKLVNLVIKKAQKLGTVARAVNQGSTALDMLMIDIAKEIKEIPDDIHKNVGRRAADRIPI